MKVVIISGGHVEDTFALGWLQNNKYDKLIAVDSGMNFLFRNGLKPDIIAGDFDSVNQDAYEYFAGNENTTTCNASTRDRQEAGKPEILRLNPIKDDTDTEFAIREAIRRGATHITILGGTGTRLDHVLGNVHLLGIGLDLGVAIELVDAHNRIRIIDSEITLGKDEQFGQFVSLLPFAGNVKGVTLEGFKYPLTDYTIESFCSLGISNEIENEKATVRLKEGLLLMIESRD